MTAKLVTLHADDNVLICCQQLEAKEQISIDGQYYELLTTIDLGHKVAKAPINKGEQIIRYGVPIGSATQYIDAAEHVHIHNMKSDYIPSHTRQSRVGER